MNRKSFTFVSLAVMLMAIFLFLVSAGNPNTIIPALGILALSLRGLALFRDEPPWLRAFMWSWSLPPLLTIPLLSPFMFGLSWGQHNETLGFALQIMIPLIVLNYTLAFLFYRFNRKAALFRFSLRSLIFAFLFCAFFISMNFSVGDHAVESYYGWPFECYEKDIGLKFGLSSLRELLNLYGGSGNLILLICTCVLILSWTNVPKEPQGLE